MDNQSVVETIDEAAVVKLASDLIRIPSPTEGEQDAMEFVERLFVNEGIESWRQEVEPGRFQLIAKIPGNGGPAPFMLNGHLDNDPLKKASERIGSRLAAALGEIKAARSNITNISRAKRSENRRG